MKIIDTVTNTTNQINCLLDQGIDVIIRYYSENSWKVLTTTEADAIASAGLQMMTIYEDAGDKLESFTKEKGYDNAKTAYFSATIIGQPQDSAIYFGVDFDATEEQMQTNIIPYFQAVKQGLEEASEGGVTHKIGAYGGGAVVNTLYEEGLCEYRWLAKSSDYRGTESALNNGDYELAQKNEQACEICTIFVDRDELKDGVTDIGAFSLNTNTSSFAQ